MSKWTLFLLSLLPAGLWAGTIPDSLLVRANQVVLEDEMVFTIWGTQRAQTTRHYQTLVLQKPAFEENAVVLHYSDFIKVKQAQVVVRNGEGRELKKYNLKDFSDIAATGSELASDDRIKVLEIPEFTPPVTLEVDYTIEYKGYMFYPRWYPLRSEKQSVLSASFSVDNRSGAAIRYRNLNLGEPEIEEGAEGTVYTWAVANLPAFEWEAFGGPAESFLPVVVTAPSGFEMDGYAGDMSSWQAFGHWFNQLNKGKNDLSEAQLSEVRALVDGLSADQEKVQAVYAYLQERMRYVSIQLGIGGWQPFSASFVHEKKYGDCKALTFYTKALLDALGIPSYYTLVRAGDDERHVIVPDFPSPFFNHVFLTVPFETDTIWLECTSQTAPLGYLGTFTSDRNALLIAADGGHLIHTRVYSADENVQRTRATIQYAADGSTHLAIDRRFEGLEVERDGLHFLSAASKQEQEDWLHEHLGNLSAMEEWTLHPLAGAIVPQAGFSIEATLSNWKGNRIFAQAGELIRDIGSDLPSEGRRSPVDVPYSFSELDTVTFVFPEAFAPETLPKPVDLETPYGSYHRSFEVLDGQRARLVRKWVLHKGLHAVTDYPAFREFILEVRKADRQRMVWKKEG